MKKKIISISILSVVLIIGMASLLTVDAKKFFGQESNKKQEKQMQYTEGIDDFESRDEDGLQMISSAKLAPFIEPSKLAIKEGFGVEIPDDIPITFSSYDEEVKELYITWSNSEDDNVQINTTELLEYYHVNFENVDIEAGTGELCYFGVSGTFIEDKIGHFKKLATEAFKNQLNINIPDSFVMFPSISNYRGNIVVNLRWEGDIYRDGILASEDSYSAGFEGVSEDLLSGELVHVFYDNAKELVEDKQYNDFELDEMIVIAKEFVEKLGFKNYTKKTDAEIYGVFNITFEVEDPKISHVIVEIDPEINVVVGYSFALKNR